MALDTHVLIIGAGMSGMCTAIQLMKKYKTQNFAIIEKSNQVAGTWSANTYPGCGCDVASHFYSFSFDLNPNWTEKFAVRSEIQNYLEGLADKYGLRNHVRLKTAVDSARWDETSASWIVFIRNLDTGLASSLRCKILVSAVGGLSIPKQCEIPGASNFKGAMFHSAQWDHSFDWKGKKVVVIGNGCSATQFVPIISARAGAVEKVTQFANQAHWLAERPNPTYSAAFKWAMQWVPLAMRSYRAKLYWEKEKDFRSFHIELGAKYRDKEEKKAAAYIREHAPAEYRDFLVPKTKIGCKRRVNDTDYLACLHRENVELVHDDPVQEITDIGVRTRSGKIVEADAILLATGFETQKTLFPMNIYGQDCESVNEHWQRVSDGGPSAYLGTCLAGFPNFFIMMGPNTLSGHLSVIYTTEAQVGFMMRVIRPIVKTLARSKPGTDIAVIKPGAEKRDLEETQEKARQLVWASGCTSWNLDKVTGRNTVMFPDFQYKFWLKSVRVRWNDIEYLESNDKGKKETVSRNGSG